MKNRKYIYADIALFIVAIIWGTGFVITKNALDYITPYYMLAIRFSIASILLGTIFFKRIRKASKKDLKAGLIVGSFLFIAFATQTIGLKYTTASKQAFITATNVVMVPFIYGAIAKTRPSSYEIFGAALCVVGIGILSFERGMAVSIGDILTLICAIFYALQISSIGYYAKDADPVVLSTLQFFVAAILSLIFALLFEPRIVSLHKEAIIPVLYLGVFSTMLAFLIQTIAQKYTPSTHTAIILSLEAVFGSIFSLIFLKEPFTIKFLIGCMAIFISVIASETKLEFLNKNEKAPLNESQDLT